MASMAEQDAIGKRYMSDNAIFAGAFDFLSGSRMRTLRS